MLEFECGVPSRFFSNWVNLLKPLVPINLTLSIWPCHQPNFSFIGVKDFIGREIRNVPFKISIIKLR